MSGEKLTIALVESLTEKELYTVAKFYLKEVGGIEKVIICNGPWDSGIDLNANSYETQIQATVEEKNFEKKLFTDIAKAQSNVAKYNLTNQVKYFYSFPLSNTLMLRYKKKAKDDYGIILEIIEANTIADVSNEYSEIAKLLYDLSNLASFQKESSYFDNVKVKAYYDLMSFGKATDIKYNIIKSYILNFLFNNTNETKTVVLSKTNEHFSSNFDHSYFDSVLARLSSEQKIKYNNDEVILLDKERDRIKTVLQNYEIEEGLLLRDIDEALKKNGINDCVDEIVKQLAELYENTYSINLSELTYKDSVIYDLKTGTQKLKELLIRISDGLLSEFEIDALIKILIKIADSSEILPRIAAGQVYSKVSDPDRLQRYVSQNVNNKTIFLDANVILNLFLVFYHQDADYNNYNYKVANQFYKFYNKNELILKTIQSYSKEVAAKLKEALAIIPFTKLKVFDALGGSGNLFYKFFQYLNDFGLLTPDIQSFEDFLKEFRLSSKTKVEDSLKSQMDYLLSSIGVEIEYIDQYDYNKAGDLIREDLKTNQRTKSNFAIISDALMFERLADNRSEINPVDPIFCTWDLSLMRVRKAYFEKFPGCTKWYMFTPTRLMDHISMMNFQIKPGTVSNEILTILDQDFSFQQMTHTLLDSVAVIINTENVVGLRYTNKLAEMREKEVLEVDAKIEAGNEGTETPQIDIIFRKLFETFVLSNDKSQLFKKLFTKEEYFDDIINVLDNEIKLMAQGNYVSDQLIKSIENLIEKESQQSQSVVNTHKSN